MCTVYNFTLPILIEQMQFISTQTPSNSTVMRTTLCNAIPATLWQEKSLTAPLVSAGEINTELGLEMGGEGRWGG